MKKLSLSIILLPVITLINPVIAQTKYHLISGFNDAAKGFGIGYATNSKDSVLVLSTFVNSPAALAGLQKGDLIETVNGTNIKKLNADSLARFFAAAKETNNIFTIVRNSRPLQLTINKAPWETYNFTCKSQTCDNGTCEILLANGLLLKGSCKNGRINGEGTSYYDDGTVFYKGNFKNNVMEGKGVITWFSGPKYEGELKDGRFNGTGTYYISEKQFRKGQWQNGKMEGKGFFQIEPGNWYEGDFINDNYEGKGIYHFTDGSLYDGQWANSEMNGKGVFTYKDKSRYEGDFKNNERNGQGKFTFTDGRTYTGLFAKGDFVKGTLMYADGKIITGEFLNFAPIAGKTTSNNPPAKKQEQPVLDNTLCEKLQKICKNNGVDLYDLGGDKFLRMAKADVANADSVFTVSPNFQLPGTKKAEYIFYNKRTLLADGNMERVYSFEVSYNFTDKSTSLADADKTWNDILTQLQNCFGNKLSKEDNSKSIFSNLVTTYNYAENGKIIFRFSKLNIKGFGGPEWTAVYIEFKTADMKDIEKTAGTPITLSKKIDKEKLCRQLKQLAEHSKSGFKQILGQKKEALFSSFDNYMVNYEKIEGSEEAEIAIVNAGENKATLKINFANYKTITQQETAALGALIKQVIEQCFSISFKGTGGRFTFYDKTHKTLADLYLALSIYPENGTVELEMSFN